MTSSSILFTGITHLLPVDQIMQKRIRDSRNKAVYARDENGLILGNGRKKGVPLSDVWEIPFLNPKAKERVGFPTQKPVHLLRQIIELVTDEGDLVVDPFCGSGTTLVAAQLLNRKSIGIDTSKEAVQLTRKRLKDCVVTGVTLDPERQRILSSTFVERGGSLVWRGVHSDSTQ